MKHNGFFVTFEGADGSGKSTQLEKVIKYFQENNLDFIATRDPGGTELGKKLREILLNYDGEISSNCELFLYLADRAQHVDEKIIPALNQGKTIICDRYTDSTVSYQGYGRGLNITEINNLNNIVTKGVMPDLTLLFDVDTETAMKRVGSSKDRLEAEGAEFHRKVRNGYLELAKNSTDRITVIDASKSVEEVFDITISVILKALNRKK